MTPHVLVRDFTCPVCGAPRTTHEDALVVLCRHCGGVLSSTGAGMPWRDIAERHAEGIRQMVKPSQLSARLTALSLSMAAPSVMQDRPLWRLLCEEQMLLTAIVHPNATAPLPSDPRSRAEHVRRAVLMSEIATFDAGVRGHLTGYGHACAELGRGPDPVATARIMLGAARAYYRALVDHPDFPAGALREGAEHHAKELVRSAIGGFAPLLGEGVVERIRVEVLGDALEPLAGVRCSKCGAPLTSETTLQRCKFCGAVTDVDPADAWMSARLGLWKVTLDELVRGERLDGPTPAISALGSFLYTDAASVSAEKAVRFLARAIPWMPLGELIRAVDILLAAMASHPTKRRLLEEIRAIAQRDWRCDPSARPRKEAPPKAHPPPTEADEAAWIESALALWSHRRGPLIELLGHPLGAIQVAAVHDVPAGVSPRAAIRFFERAAPGFDRRAMREEVSRLAPGLEHPRVAAFLAELSALLA